MVATNRKKNQNYNTLRDLNHLRGNLLRGNNKRQSYYSQYNYFMPITGLINYAHVVIYSKTEACTQRSQLVLIDLLFPIIKHCYLSMTSVPWIWTSQVCQFYHSTILKNRFFMSSSIFYKVREGKKKTGQTNINLNNLKTISWKPFFLNTK